MNFNDDVQNIREALLKKRPSYQTTNKKEVRVRCPYCGDSRRDLSSAHLYIEMKAPFRFHCFKCEVSGALNNQVLRDLELYDASLNSSIISANRNLKENSGVHKISLKKNIKLNNEVTFSEPTCLAVDYFNKRYQTDLSPEFISSKFRVVLDGVHFFNKNNIYIPGNQYQIDKSIGFISSDSSHIIFRDISGLQKRRYYNCNLNMVEDTISSKIYNISSSIDILSEQVNLVITEGIFDIIGVYLHFYKDTPKENNTIFAAACGKSFNAVILNYIRLGFLNLNITIYSDADVDISFFKDLKSQSPYLKNKKIEIYYNSLYDPKTGYGKDFGVPKCDISLRRAII